MTTTTLESLSRDFSGDITERPVDKVPSVSLASLSAKRSPISPYSPWTIPHPAREGSPWGRHRASGLSALDDQRRRWGMPGMDMGSGSGAAASTVAEIALFWAATVIHLLRLLSPARLPDLDRPADAGHAAMGAGMTLMVFPGVWPGTLHVAAAGYGVLAVAYLARATAHRPAHHRCQNTAIGAGQAAMAYMLAAPAHPPSWLPPGVAGVLAVCALVHARRLVDARHRHGDDAGAPRMLVTGPHVGALVMTVAMAAMVGVA